MNIISKLSDWHKMYDATICVTVVESKKLITGREQTALDLSAAAYSLTREIGLRKKLP